ncbi:MAG: hypothetical protein AAF570_20335, partial [Bacteroidota bacterium]
VEKLVDEDKISQDEGKKIVDDLLTNTEAKRNEFEAKLKSIVEDVMVKMNLATQTQVKDLQDRIAALEEKAGINAEAKEEAPASKKKAPAKKAAAAEA